MKRKFLFWFIPLFILASLFSLSHAQVYKVEQVIDGDTLFLANGEYVRLIGVDTPETKHPEKPVEYFGKQVRLEYDQTRSISEYPPDTKVIHYPQCPIA